jgi:signal peptidase I
MAIGLERVGLSRAVPSRRGVPIAVALATFCFSAAIGAVASRRWRRASFWLGTEWMWVGFTIGAILGSHPRLSGAAFAIFGWWRVVSAIDAYRLAQRVGEHARWATLIRACVVLTVGALVVFLGVVRPFFVEGFWMPSRSMLPTLLPGDHFFVDKRRWTPVRGAVVLLKYPLDPSINYVRRVVGIPGDTVQVTRDGLVVNGQVAPRERLAQGCVDGETDSFPGEPPTSCTRSLEMLDGREYEIATAEHVGGKDMHPFIVPSGHVYVLSDNRDNGEDSRVWGPVRWPTSRVRHSSSGRRRRRRAPSAGIARAPRFAECGPMASVFVPLRLVPRPRVSRQILTDSRSLELPVRHYRLSDKYLLC